MQNILDSYPAIDDLKQRAQKRLPFFVWEQLVSGTGLDRTVARNREALDSITLMPRYARNTISPSRLICSPATSYACNESNEIIGQTNKSRV